MERIIKFILLEICIKLEINLQGIYNFECINAFIQVSDKFSLKSKMLSNAHFEMSETAGAGVIHFKIFQLYIQINKYF